MINTISFHSSRGGTGKTIVASNLAVLLASKGLNVALMDLDFRAPSLLNVFRKGIVKSPNYWINDYLDSSCTTKDFLIDVKTIYHLKGRLLLGFADPSIRAIEDMISKNRSWEARALKKLFELRNDLERIFDTGFCFLDTSPGIQYSSLNAMVASDRIVFVTTSDALDLEQVAAILKEYREIFGDKTHILINKGFPEKYRWSAEIEEDFLKQLPKGLNKLILDIIPCYCDVLKAENRLLAIEKTDHPFVRVLEDISQRIIA